MFGLSHADRLSVPQELIGATLLVMALSPVA